ncbi:unnamed protein product [Schistosoma margrebowiei]|uniref:Uncharacterized protein n=1 Tax=Schistosoma margrebowiei TaxID=48269 RepID=A0A183M483_9TREM|nr:unnamed protein product [Schistosoma margrebowiei]
MSRLIWPYYTCTFFRKPPQYGLKLWYRYFIPDSYASVDIWNARLSSDIFQNISAHFASAVLMMDVFLRKGEWNSAVAVSWELCLQEYFSLENVRPLVLATSLYSCMKSIENDSYVVKEPEPADDKEIEQKLVPYVRNPSYDNFFDIKHPKLKTGYTLLHLSHVLNSRCSLFQTTPVWNSLSKYVDSFRLMMRIFGLALSEQCDKLLVELRKIDESAIQLGGFDPIVTEKLTRIVDTCETRSDDSSLKPGEPQLPSVSDVKSVQNELVGGSQCTTPNFFKLTEEFIFNGVINNSDCMKQELETLSDLYSKFDEERRKEYTEAVKMQKSEEVLKKTKETLREILDKEEQITYFQNNTKIIKDAWLAPRTRQEARWSRLKEWRSEILSQRQKQDNSSPVQ